MPKNTDDAFPFLLYPTDNRDVLMVLERYFLFGKPRNYLLKNWEVNECLNPTVYDRRVYKNIISLEPYFISFLRDKKLKILCKQENLDHTMV